MVAFIVIVIVVVASLCTRINGDLTVVTSVSKTWNDGKQHTQCAVVLTNTDSQAICTSTLEMRTSIVVEQSWNLVSDPDNADVFTLPSWMHIDGNGGSYRDIGMIVAGSKCPEFMVVYPTYCDNNGQSQTTPPVQAQSTTSVPPSTGPNPPPTNSSNFIYLSDSAPGKTTRYWDCCKVSCGWNGKGPLTSPVTSCQKDGKSKADVNAASGCNGGPSYACTSNQPWAINSDLSYGFAAAHLTGKSEQDWCCACYELTFTSSPVKGKRLVVQIINTGGDLGENHFDLQIPGGGVGIFNGCSSQFGAPADGWGARYGGVGSKSECKQLPSELQPGCDWRFDWFMGADNPQIQLRRVKCPTELTEKTNCRRTDE